MKKSDVIVPWVTGFFFFYYIPLLGLLLLGLAVVNTFRALALGFAPSGGTSHGTARFCTWPEAQAAGLLSGDGLVLGRADGLHQDKDRRSEAKLLRLQSFTHLATFAPTGRGKGVSVIIPNLLMFGKSVVVSDPKGENFRLTAAYRQHRFGHRILRLDVATPGGDCLNPLDFIDPQADDFLEQCRELAVMLVKREEGEKEPHWNDMAELIICSIIAFVCACERERAERNLITVRHILLSRERFVRTLNTMQQVPGFNGLIAELGQQLTWPTERELSSIMSTVQRHTAFLDSPAVARCVMRSSFDPMILRTPQGASLYLCFPHDRLKALAPLNRMWVGTLLKLLTRGMPTEEHRVLFLLDEVAHLGRLPSLEESVTLHRGMGIRLWFFWQSIEQVKFCYREFAATYLENIDTKQYFGTNSYESAKAISDHIGETTILVESVNRTHSRTRPDRVALQPSQPGSSSVSTSRTVSELGRHLIKPDEVIRLPEGVSLITHRNLPVIRSTQVKYYADPEFADYRQLAVGGFSPALPGKRARRRIRLPGPVIRFGIELTKAVAVAAMLTFVVVTLLWAAHHQAAPPSGNRPAPIGEASSVAAPPAASEPLPVMPWAMPSPPPMPELSHREPSRAASAPARYSGFGQSRSTAATPHCYDPKWCPDPLNCPRFPRSSR